MTNIILSTDGFYYVYCNQLNVATAVVERQGDGKIKCLEYISLAARQATSEFAKDPEAVIKDVDREMKKVCSPKGEGGKNTDPKPLWLGIKTNHGSSGLSVSYEQRRRDLENIETGVIEDLNYWDQKSMLGAQVGFHFDKYFAPKFFGLGVHTGIYAGYYSLAGQTSPDENNKLSFQEIRLYIPLQGIYRLDFSENIGCFISYGLSADIGLYSHIKQKNEVTDIENKNMYDKEEWGNIKRLNYSLVYGAGVQIDHLMLSVSADKGLLNQSNDPSFKIYEHRNIRLGLTIMF
jgi:hypothetical protein